MIVGEFLRRKGCILLRFSFLILCGLVGIGVKDVLLLVRI